jgi:quercetin dioxygenase-like cupin family protein
VTAEGEGATSPRAVHGLRFITAREMDVEDSLWGPHEWLSRPPLTDAQGLLMVRVRMPPRRAHQFHRHPAMEEIIYVISGTAEQWVDRDSRILGPGDIAHIPRDVVHGTYNAGDDTLVFLAILSPAQFAGPALIDVHTEEPWRSLKTPVAFTADGAP